MVEEMPPPLEPVPGVTNSYSFGWRRLWKNFMDLLLAGIVYVVLLVVVGLVVGVAFSVGWRDSIPSLTNLLGGSTMTTFTWHFLIVSDILQIFLFTPLFWGLLFLFFCAAAGRTVELQDLFLGFRRHYLRVAETSLLWWLVLSLPSNLVTVVNHFSGAAGVFLSVVWTIASIFLYSHLIFVPFLLMDRQLFFTDAFRTSWEWSRGHALENFGIFVMGILVMIGGLIVFVAGVVPAAMWMGLAFASQYYAVTLEKGNPVVYPSPMMP